MRRQLWMCVAASAFFGLSGCMVDSGEPTGEELGEAGAALGAEPTGGVATPAGDTAAGRPPSIVSADDPSGPTPYPWQSSDDPSGPTPYPWDDEGDDPTEDGHTQPSDPTSGSTAHASSTKK